MVLLSDTKLEELFVVEAGYDVDLVFLSILISVFSSYCSIFLARRKDDFGDEKEKLYWNLIVSVFLGIGIWSMHFVGMMAYKVSVDVTFNFGITFLSIFPAIMAGYFVFNNLGLRSIWPNSILMALGIGGMHYLGMSAMSSSAMMVYSPKIVILSLIISTLLSYFSLFAVSNVKKPSYYNKNLIVAALLLGFSISTMHYFGMEAMQLYSHTDMNAGEPSSQNSLPTLIIAVTSIFGISILIMAELRYRRILLIKFESALSVIQDSLFIFSNNGKIIYFNSSACRLLNLSNDELSGKYINEIFHFEAEENELLFKQILIDYSSKEIDKTIRSHVVSRGFGKKAVSINVKRFPTYDGSFICTVKDMSNLENHEVFIQKVFDELPLMVFVKDIDSLVFTHVNNETLRFLGKHKTNVIGHTDFDIFNIDDAQYSFNSDVLFIESGLDKSFYAGNFVVNGNTRYLRITKSIIKDVFGKPKYLLSIAEDASLLMKAQSKIKSLNKRLSMATDAAQVGVWEWNTKSNNLIWDRQMHKIYDVDLASFENWKNKIHKDDRDHVLSALHKSVELGNEFHSEFRITSIGGDVKYIRADSIIENDIMFGINFDITEKVLKENAIKNIALSDSLTGLRNRAYLRDYFDDLVHKYNRTQQPFICFYIDLDLFKPINDQFGHNAGDFCLVEFSRRLKEKTRITDCVARVGGDEFVIITSEYSSKLEIEQYISRIFEIISLPFHYESNHLVLGMSLGFASYPDDGNTLDEIIHVADTRMLNSKASKRN